MYSAISFTALRLILTFFLRGLLLVVPTALTIFILVQVISWIDNLIPLEVPGVGLVTVLVTVTLIGFLANTIIAKPIIRFLEEVLQKIPLVGFIYSAINDLVTAFVGDKQKFDRPVLIPFDENGLLYKPGFITQSDLEKIGLPGMVTVYMPHSYNFSGNVFIVRSEKLILLKGKNTDIMKYIVSGGVSGKIKLK
ncbi:MAG: DUF502 domain-containing protein [Cyclobacteriaceae bacterium]